MTIKRSLPLKKRLTKKQQARRRRKILRRSTVRVIEVKGEDSE